MPCLASLNVSYPNVLYVVSAPQKPIPTPAISTVGSRGPPPATMPRMNDPTTLTVNVPHGNTVS